MNTYLPSEEIAKGLGISFTIWNILNLIAMIVPIKDIHLSREDRLDMRNRMVSFVHGCISFSLASYHAYFLYNECGSLNSEFEKLCLYISCGYFMYDFAAMGVLGLMDWGMFIHHTMCIVGAYISLCEGISGNYFVMALYITEISNPVMHCRVIIKHQWMRYTK